MPMTSPTETCYLYYLLAVVMVPVWAAFPPSLRYPIPVALNKITDVRLSCDSENVNVTVTMQQPFKGVIFAKDFVQGCKVFGDLSNSVTINLPTSSCGVRLTSTTHEDGTIRMFYSVVLVAQQDRHLRLISDQERLLECDVEEEAFLVKSRPMMGALKKWMSGGLGQENHRVGRMRYDDGWSRPLKPEEIEEELQEAMTAARAWMEIIPEKNEERPVGTIQVGETALLTVKATLPNGIGWSVVDCAAHDGLGDSSQKLLDDYGCPVDELLMPVPKFGPVRPIAQMRHQEAVARFAAFKFPDRDKLHFICGLQLCRGDCVKVDCEKTNASLETEENRVARAVLGSEGEVLDRLEVFNSVEVLSPEIDDLRKEDKMSSSDFATYPFTNIPGDRTFCVSPDKMAIAFCILGFIFLCAVLVAACSLLRARRSNGGNFPYYTRSLFSSSSGGSAFGSKLLINDSPCLGQSVSTARMQYGRIL